MKSITRYVQMTLRLALIALLLCASLFLWEMRQAAREVQTAVKDTDSAVKEIQRRVVDTSQNLNAALIQVGLMTDEARRASIEQRQYWNRVSAETVGAVKDVRAAVGDARELLQASTQTINRTSDDLHGTVTSLNDGLIVLESTLQSLDNTVRDADRNFAANPDMTRALKNFADAGDQVNKTTANVAAMSEDVRQKVHDLTHPKPQSLAKVVLNGMLNIAYKVRAFF